MSIQDFVVRDRREAGHHWQDNEFCDNVGPLVGALGCAVYMYLTRHAHAGKVTVSTRTLADVCQASRATVWRAIQVLEHLQVIRAANGGQGKLPEYELANIKNLMISLGATFNQKRCSWLLSEEILKNLRAEIDGLREGFRSKTSPESPTVSPESQSVTPQLFHQRASTVSPETPTVSPESQSLYTRLQDYKTKPPNPPLPRGACRDDDEAQLLEAIHEHRAAQPKLEDRAANRAELLRLQAQLLALRKQRAVDAGMSEGPPRQSPKPSTPKGSLDELTAWLMRKCGFLETGRRQPVLAPALRGVIAMVPGAESQRVAEMAEAWSAYARGPALWGPKKFFAEGHWQRPASWPSDGRVFDPCAPRQGAVA